MNEACPKMTIPGLFVIELNKCFPPHLRGGGHEKRHWETRTRDGEAAIGISKHTHFGVHWNIVTVPPVPPRLPPPSGCCSRLKVFNIPDLGCFFAISIEERLKTPPPPITHCGFLHLQVCNPTPMFLEQSFKSPPLL